MGASRRQLRSIIDANGTPEEFTEVMGQMRSDLTKAQGVLDEAGLAESFCLLTEAEFHLDALNSDQVDRALRAKQEKRESQEKQRAQADAEARAKRAAEKQQKQAAERQRREEEAQRREE